MIIPRSDTKQIQYDELATLKHLANDGAIGNQIEVSCSGIASTLEVSTQTVSRRLRQLENADLIDRERTNDGQRISLRPDGISALKTEYEEYKQIFGSQPTLVLDGHVTSGMGRGRHFIALSGYQDQFTERLGYEPFPGTLNIQLAEDTGPRRAALEAYPSIPIDSWEEDDDSYGAAVCYSVTLESNGATYDSAHLLVPDRTDHTASQLEIIAPDRLRDELDLSDGDHVTVHVTAN